jgi:hypothetical protein
MIDIDGAHVGEGDGHSCQCMAHRTPNRKQPAARRIDISPQPTGYPAGSSSGIDAPDIPEYYEGDGGIDTRDNAPAGAPLTLPSDSQSQISSKTHRSTASIAREIAANARDNSLMSVIHKMGNNAAEREKQSIERDRLRDQKEEAQDRRRNVREMERQKAEDLLREERELAASNALSEQSTGFRTHLAKLQAGNDERQRKKQRGKLRPKQRLHRGRRMTLRQGHTKRLLKQRDLRISSTKRGPTLTPRPKGRRKQIMMQRLKKIESTRRALKIQGQKNSRKRKNGSLRRKQPILLLKKRLRAIRQQKPWLMRGPLREGRQERPQMLTKSLLTPESKKKSMPAGSTVAKPENDSQP